MALLRTSPEIESLRGSYGGMYFKKDSSGQHVQSWPRHIYRYYPPVYPIPHDSPPRPGRGLLTLAFTKTSELYKLLMTLGFLAAWVGIAETAYFTKHGKRYRATPRSLWLHANTKRVARDLEPLMDAHNWLNYGRVLDYKVRCDGTPDCSGIYSESGQFQGVPVYSSPDEEWTLWQEDENHWVISRDFHTRGTEGFVHFGNTQRGFYYAYGTATFQCAVTWYKAPRSID